MKRPGPLLWLKAFALLALCLWFVRCNLGNDPEDVPLNPPADESTYVAYGLIDSTVARETIGVETGFQWDSLDIDIGDPTYDFTDTLKTRVRQTIHRYDSIYEITEFRIKNSKNEVVDTLIEKYLQELDSSVQVDTLEEIELLKNADSLIWDSETLASGDSSWTDTLPGETEVIESVFSYSRTLTGDSLILIQFRVEETSGDERAVDSTWEEKRNLYIRADFGDPSDQPSDLWQFIPEVQIANDTDITPLAAMVDTTWDSLVVAEDWITDPEALTSEIEHNSRLEVLVVEPRGDTLDTALIYPAAQMELSDWTLEDNMVLDTNFEFSPWQIDTSAQSPALFLAPGETEYFGSLTSTLRYLSADYLIQYRALRLSRIWSGFFPVDSARANYWTTSADASLFTGDEDIFSLASGPGDREGDYHYYTTVSSVFQLEGDFEVEIQVDVPAFLTGLYGAGLMCAAVPNPEVFHVPPYIPDFSPEKSNLERSNMGVVLNSQSGANSLKPFIFGSELSAVGGIPDDPFLRLRREGDLATIAYFTVDDSREIILDSRAMDAGAVYIVLVSMITKDAYTASGSVAPTTEFKRFRINQGRVRLSP